MANFASAPVFSQLAAGLQKLPASERESLVKKANGVFEVQIKNSSGQEKTWTLELKKNGVVVEGKAEKADIVLLVPDEVFVDLAAGKTTGQKAFMTGKLKVKGNMMLATKLDAVLKTALAASPAPQAAATAAAPATGTASGVAVAAFASSKVFESINDGLSVASPQAREAIIKKAQAIFQFDVKNASGTVQTWTLDLKTGQGSVATGVGSAKPSIVIAVADNDFVDLAGGKLNGQKAFMAGKIKVKGQMMLATKLDSILKELTLKSRL